MASKKDKTYEQAEATQAKAVRFLRDVVGDEEKASEIESLSVDEYAERKGLRLLDPTSTSTVHTQRRNTMSIIYQRNPAGGEEIEREVSQMSKPELVEAVESFKERDVRYSEGCDRIGDAVIAFEENELTAQEMADEIWEALSEIDSDAFPPEDDEEEDEPEN